MTKWVTMEEAKTQGWPWRHFAPEEMACPCCDKVIRPCDHEFRRFMDRLEAVRLLCDFEFPVNSGCRCPANEKAHGRPADGPHTEGAVDTGLAGWLACAAIALWVPIPSAGIGLVQHGDYSKRYVHLDLCGVRLWTYPDKGV